MKKLSILLFVTLFSVSSYANDNLGVYVGVGTGVTSGKFTPKKGEEAKGLSSISRNNNNAINLFAGYNILPYLAVEAEYNYRLSISQVNKDSSKGKSSKKLASKYSDQSFFANVVGKYPILDQHIPFVKLGIGHVNYKHDNSNISKGLAYKIGAGYEFAITKNHSLVAEYNYTMAPKVNLASKNGKSFKTNIKNAGKINYSTVSIAYKFTF